MLHKTKTLFIAAAIGGLTLLTAGTAVAGEAKFKDLVGGDAIKAFDIMTSRGFKSVDSYSAPDGNVVSWWYHPKTGQCINTQSQNNKVVWAEADKYPKCNEAAEQAGGEQASSSAPSQKAKKACAAKFGGKSTVKTVTAGKPGWWEIILTGKKGRQVACTVEDSGQIGDWVEM